MKYATKIELGKRYKVREDLEDKKHYQGVFYSRDVMPPGVITFDWKADDTTAPHNGLLYSAEMLIPLDETDLESIQAGDVITDGKSYKMILQRDDFLVHYGNSFSDEAKAKKSLIVFSKTLHAFLDSHSHWHIHTESPTSDVTTVTMDEIAKWKGIDVDNLRVEKGD